MIVENPKNDAHQLSTALVDLPITGDPGIECRSGGASGDGYHSDNIAAAQIAQTLIERWDGTAWTIVPSPDTLITQDNVLYGVTCAAVSDCWTVGSYYNESTETFQTLIEHWDGTLWDIVTLTGVTNAQVITVGLTNVNDSAGNSSAGGIAGSMGVLLGDTNGNGAVNASDISQTKSQSGQTATATNFRTDVNVNGVVNASDISTVKSRSGTALP